MNPITQHQLDINRRHFFGRSATGIGTAALATLLGKEGLSAAPKGNNRIPAYIRQIAPKAKRVIYLFQNGAPTHCDLWDYKPKLKELHNTPVPESYVGGKRFSTMTGNANGKLPAPPHNASGHTWHHTGQQLFDLTKFGPKILIGGEYQTDMPGYKDILSDEEIIAVLSYIKSKWPGEIRARHDAIEKKASGK